MFSALVRSIAISRKMGKIAWGLVMLMVGEGLFSTAWGLIPISLSSFNSPLDVEVEPVISPYVRAGYWKFLRVKVRARQSMPFGGKLTLHVNSNLVFSYRLPPLTSGAEKHFYFPFFVPRSFTFSGEEQPFPLAFSLKVEGEEPPFLLKPYDFLILLSPSVSLEGSFLPLPSMQGVFPEGGKEKANVPLVLPNRNVLSFPFLYELLMINRLDMPQEEWKTLSSDARQVIRLWEGLGGRLKIIPEERKPSLHSKRALPSHLSNVERELYSAHHDGRGKSSQKNLWTAFMEVGHWLYEKKNLPEKLHHVVAFNVVALQFLLWSGLLGAGYACLKKKTQFQKYKLAFVFLTYGILQGVLGWGLHSQQGWAKVIRRSYVISQSAYVLETSMYTFYPFSNSSTLTFPSYVLPIIDFPREKGEVVPVAYTFSDTTTTMDLLFGQKPFGEESSRQRYFHFVLQLLQYDPFEITRVERFQRSTIFIHRDPYQWGECILGYRQTDRRQFMNTLPDVLKIPRHPGREKMSHNENSVFQPLPQRFQHYEAEWLQHLFPDQPIWLECFRGRKPSWSRTPFPSIITHQSQRAIFIWSE